MMTFAVSISSCDGAENKSYGQFAVQYDLAGSVERRQRSGTDNVQKTFYNDHERDKSLFIAIRPY